MGVMDRLQSIEELERGLRGMYRGQPLDSTTEEACATSSATRRARPVGSPAHDDQLEQRGLVEHDQEVMRLTARGSDASDRRHS